MKKEIIIELTLSMSKSQDGDYFKKSKANLNILDELI